MRTLLLAATLGSLLICGTSALAAGKTDTELATQAYIYGYSIDEAYKFF